MMIDNYFFCKVGKRIMKGELGMKNQLIYFFLGQNWKRIYIEVKGLKIINVFWKF